MEGQHIDLGKKQTCKRAHSAFETCTSSSFQLLNPGFSKTVTDILGTIKYFHKPEKQSSGEDSFSQCYPYWTVRAHRVVKMLLNLRLSQKTTEQTETHTRLQVSEETRKLHLVIQNKKNPLIKVKIVI